MANGTIATESRLLSKLGVFRGKIEASLKWLLRNAKTGNYIGHFRSKSSMLQRADRPRALDADMWYGKHEIRLQERREPSVIGSYKPLSYYM